MGALELEARVTALEEKVARLAAEKVTDVKPAHLWLDRVFGIFANDPEFEEAVQAGQEWRKTESIQEEAA